MDKIQSYLFNIQRNGLVWDTVCRLVEVMGHSVTLHDGRVCTKMDLCVPFFAEIPDARAHLARFMEENDRCEVDGIYYNRLSLYISFLELNPACLDSHYALWLLEIMDKVQHIRPVVICKKTYTRKDIALRGLHSGYFTQVERAQLKIFLASFLHDDQEVVDIGRFTRVPDKHTKISLFLSVLNDRDVPYNVRQTAFSMLSACLPLHIVLFPCVNYNGFNFYKLRVIESLRPKPPSYCILL